MTPAAAAAASSPLVVPVRQVLDIRPNFTVEQVRRFSSGIWREAVRDFDRCGVQLRGGAGTGEIRRSPGDRPILIGLERGVINLVITDHIPMKWDVGRALAGVTVLYEGYHVCMIALNSAHGHQVPFVSVNTCVHELLHAFMGDIFMSHPKWYQTGSREFRIDCYATELWLFHNGGVIRKAAETYLPRLRASGSAGQI